jgi:hypothetical protein
MHRAWTLLVIVALPILGWAQDSPSGGNSPPYTPAVPAPSMVTGYGGWPGYTGASTAAGSAMNGMANVISAKGNYNLSTSAAAVNLTQAQKQEIQNHEQFTNTYFAMRATNKAAAEAALGKGLTFSQLAEIAHEGAPQPLNTSEFDPISGKLNWPGPLQEDTFASRRAEVDQLMVQQAHYGVLSYADQMKVKKIVSTMFKDMKSQIGTIPADDYVVAKSFLNSVLYASTKTQLS